MRPFRAGWWTAAAAALLLCGCGRSGKPAVVVYASQDQVYAEPVLRQFTAETGIEVKAVYDGEMVKTVGLINRLIAEKEHPQCDVLWNNEELRMRLLERKGMLDGAWAPVGYRSRRIAVDAGLADPPSGLLELTNAVWRGRVAMGYPLFGTTSTHFMALRQKWGAEGWRAWCRALVENKTFVVDGNSVSAKFVRRGEAAAGLTDSDDIAAENREGASLRALPMNEDTLLVPNTVAVIRGAPHPAEARRLFEYLRRRDTAEKLVKAGALEGVSRDDVSVPTLKPDWPRLLDDVETATAELKAVFLR